MPNSLAENYEDDQEKQQWIPALDVFLPDLRNYASHKSFHADAGFELSVTEGIRHCLLRRQWDEGLKLVFLLHQLEDPPFELLWKAGMACLRGKIFEEEEERLQSNSHLPRQYPRTLLTEYLTSLFTLTKCEAFHILLNYEMALHLFYVHDDPMQAYEFLENLLYSHPYSELPHFLLLMGALSLHMAQRQIDNTMSSQSQSTIDLSVADENGVGTKSRETAKKADLHNFSYLLLHSGTIRFLKRARLCFRKLHSLQVTSLDYTTILRGYRETLDRLVNRFKNITTLEEGDALHTNRAAPLQGPSGTVPDIPESPPEDELPQFLERFDVHCDDEEKWKRLTYLLFQNKERITELFKYRQSWWFPFHFSHDALNPILLTYKSVIAYWVCPVKYLQLSGKIWMHHSAVPSELLPFLGTIDLEPNDLRARTTY